MYWPIQHYRALNGMSRLLDEMNRLWDGGVGPTGTGPRVNAWSNEDGTKVTLEVPGVDPKDLEIVVRDNQLVVSGEFPSNRGDEQASYHRSERRTGRFSREITLPYRIAADKVTAEGKNGVIVVTLPKPEEEKPRRITVSAA